MLNIERALGNDRLLSSLTEYNRKVLKKLLAKFAPLAERSKYMRNRQRQAGGGRKTYFKNE
jgi:hypothetical protein